VAGFDLYEAIHTCREHLLAYGGHYAAAGLSLKAENLNAFSASFEEAVSKSIKEEQLVPEIIIDTELPFDAAQLPFYRIIEQMEPFGPDNLRPVFITRKTQDSGYSKVVKEQHLQLSLRHENTTLKGIFFKAAPLLEQVQKGAVDIVYTLEKNNYKGQQSIQLKIMDLRTAMV